MDINRSVIFSSSSEAFLSPLNIERRDFVVSKIDFVASADCLTNASKLIGSIAIYHSGCVRAPEYHVSGMAKTRQPETSENTYCLIFLCLMRYVFFERLIELIRQRRADNMHKAYLARKTEVERQARQRL